jgi:hypothetical protein
LSHFSYFVGAHPSDEHLGQSRCHLRLIATVAIKDLGMEVAFSISRNLKILDGTRTRVARSRV